MVGNFFSSYKKINMGFKVQMSTIYVLFMEFMHKNYSAKYVDSHIALCTKVSRCEEFFDLHSWGLLLRKIMHFKSGDSNCPQQHIV